MLSSLYIHIPFCKKKCKYCDFNSFDNKSDKIEEYMNALYIELEDEIKKIKYSNKRENACFYTIYIGGGTPSFIDSEYIEKIINFIRENDMISQNAEITIEVNPCTVSRHKINTYKECGINRISMGLQTTNDDILKTIGRAHSFAEFEESYKIVRNVGFENVNVDLMFGLPNQDIDILKESIDYLINLNPEHISCYSLILHDSIFSDLPTDEEEREMYYYIKNSLKNSGYDHYEISNFAKKGYESKHNLVYWNQGEYLGIGAGASGYRNNERYTNEINLDKYIENIRTGKSVKHIQEVQNIEDKVREYMILRLRLLEGVDFNKSDKLFNFNVKEKFEREIKKLTQIGLLEEYLEGKIKLTDRGLDLANVVWREFV